jgi:hypothetical protein
VTLIIVPIFYILFDRFGHWLYGLTRREVNHQPHKGHKDQKLAPDKQPRPAMAPVAS